MFAIKHFAFYVNYDGNIQEEMPEHCQSCQSIFGHRTVCFPKVTEIHGQNSEAVENENRVQKCLGGGVTLLLVVDNIVQHCHT